MDELQPQPFHPRYLRPRSPAQGLCRGVHQLHQPDLESGGLHLQLAKLLLPVAIHLRIGHTLGHTQQLQRSFAKLQRLCCWGRFGHHFLRGQTHLFGREIVGKRRCDLLGGLLGLGARNLGCIQDLPGFGRRSSHLLQPICLLPCRALLLLLDRPLLLPGLNHRPLDGHHGPQLLELGKRYTNAPTCKLADDLAKLLIIQLQAVLLEGKDQGLLPAEQPIATDVILVEHLPMLPRLLLCSC
mmetsp:Transcript_81434/g.263766  ORF Transcript_81434/g.263766 Transcript_81434/m.263766 type:complete len:241 (+) Transcript_81434:766-1488(+)